MTFEEMEKTMKFILEQQAQFEANIQKLTESHVRLAEATLTNTGMIGRLTEAHTKLAQAQAESQAQQVRTDAKMAELAERLDAFILFIEKYIVERRNGKHESSS